MMTRRSMFRSLAVAPIAVIGIIKSDPILKLAPKDHLPIPLQIGRQKLVVDFSLPEGALDKFAVSFTNKSDQHTLLIHSWETLRG